jgi:ABC-type multidrug transport system fused ATPase/permease subunit
MSRLQTLASIFKKHKYQFILTNMLFATEMLGPLLRPFFLGEAVNDLIAHSYRGLIWLAASQLLWLIVGTIRHRYDTRTYSAIYTSLVTRMLSKVKNADISRLSAHTNLAREFVDFLEYDINYVIEACYNLIGSLILLFFYEKRVVVLCLLMLIPVMLLSYVYGKRMNYLNKQKNDELEKQVDVISSRNHKTIRKHFMQLRSWQIKISDQEAYNFGMMEILVLVVIIGSLLITAGGSTSVILAGDIIGIYNYILKFVTGLDTIPYTVQRIASLRDIMQRVELGVEEIETQELTT